MRRLLLSLTAPTGLALVIAGCGGSGGGSGGGYGAAGPSPAAAKPSVSTARSALGTILVDGKGRTLYLFEKDKGARSSCSGACASVWPPAPAATVAHGAAGISAARLGSIRRADGHSEATYAGHPLYFYAGDSKPGQTTGQGLDQFGGGWYVLSPDGRKIDRGS